MASPNAAYDISLFKLSRPVSIGAHSKIAAVCLPPPASAGKHFLLPEKGIVAGWGFQYHRCQTSIWGPSKFLPCAESWTYNGNSYAQGDCEKTVDPPSGHPECAEFRAAANLGSVRPLSRNVVIRSASAGIVECAPKRPPPSEKYFGWCATCTERRRHTRSERERIILPPYTTLTTGPFFRR